jgi:hypothetical protein
MTRAQYRVLALSAFLILAVSAGSVRAGDTPVQEAAAAPPVATKPARVPPTQSSVILTPAALLSFALMASSGTSLPQTGANAPGR